MIDIIEVKQLLQSPDSKNLICRNLEFRPQNLAMFIAALSNMPEGYGYILIGLIKNTNNYSINGISNGFILDEPIKWALSLLSEQPLIEFGPLIIEGKNIYAIKVINVENEIFSVSHKIQSH